MNYLRIAQHLEAISKELRQGIEVTPEPTPPTPQPPQSIPEPTPEPKGMLLSIHFVNVNFAKGEYIDVNINGTWYNLSERNHDSNWDINVFGSRGVVLNVDNVKTIQFRDNQIRRSGLPFGGYGYFNYKIGARPTDFDLFNPVEAPEAHPNFWARWFRQPTVSGFDEYADLIGANGSISGRPEAQIDSYIVPEEWNSTGKVSLIIGMVGRAEWS